MGWLLFIFLLYFLCLLVERALVGVSAHDADVLRGEDGRAARQASSLSIEIRPTLAALLLARILLLSLAGVITAVLVMRSPIINDWLYQITEMSGFSPNLVWGLTGIILALVLSLVVWGLQKIDFQENYSGRSALILKRLWWVALFWKTVFKVFTQKENNKETTGEGKEPVANSTDITSAASEKRELELLKSIVQFGDVTVKQVMQPRSKVVSVDFKTGFQELLEVVRQSEFSRLPVYDEVLDNITGILYVKDLVPHLDHEDSFEWQPLIRTNVLMVPEAKRGSELLQEFKQQRMHMAAVVDEYGGISGIVTMEDILEEVTGDIRDEFDEESEIRYRKIDDYNYLFEGQTLLNDVCRLSGLAPGTFDVVRGTSDTLAGLALELRGDIPLIGTEVAWNGFLLSVTIADKRRIEQLKLSLPKPAL
ncbi:MAG: CBS domain-containing protein [Saprospiraceae bacterium]|nr:CBS domain-containing protein [Saprospiraceae bacterium]